VLQRSPRALKKIRLTASVRQPAGDEDVIPAAATRIYSEAQYPASAGCRTGLQTASPFLRSLPRIFFWKAC